MSDNNQPRERAKSIFTQSQINSYERSFSAMSFTMVNGNGLLVLSPIFDEFIGKDPKKGDNVYDHDSKMNFSIDPQAAIQLRKGVADLVDNEELKSFSMSFGTEKTRRTLTIFKPNTVKLIGKNFDNYILKLTQTKDDGEEKMYHLMQRSTAAFKNIQNEILDDELEVDMMMVGEFCTRVIDNAFGVAHHGARRNSAFVPQGGGARQATTRRVVEEEGGGEEEGEAPSRPVPKAGGKRTNLTDEFKDD